MVWIEDSEEFSRVVDEDYFIYVGRFLIGDVVLYFGVVCVEENFVERGYSFYIFICRYRRMYIYIREYVYYTFKSYVFVGGGRRLRGEKVRFIV